MRGHGVVRSLLVILLASGVLRCSPADRADRAADGTRAVDRDRPNIVLIVLCSFRADRIGAAGRYSRSLTPFLDRLVARGTYFDRAVSAASWTKPATASLLSGLAPNVHGLTDYYKASEIRAGLANPRRGMPKAIVTLAELLGDSGYQTASRVNNIHAGEYFDVTQGFASRRTTTRRRTVELVESFAAWLDRIDRNEPFFFLLFTLEAHSPYRPDFRYYSRISRRPDPVSAVRFESFRQGVHDEVMRRLRDGTGWPEELRRDWIDLYDAGIAQLDSALSGLQTILEEAGVAERTIIALTADHGERFFEHGRVDHGWFPDEPVLRIPIVLAGKGIPPSRRVSSVVRSIDLYPTIAELAGVATPSMVQGSGLLPLVRGDAPKEERTAFSMGGGDQDFALRRGRFKLRLDLKKGRPPRLYDVEADPLEEDDLAPNRPQLTRSLVRELGRWIQQAEDLRGRVGAYTPIDLDPKALETLESLGYIER
jgi:arylsulfatase A-like enzyme